MNLLNITSKLMIAAGFFLVLSVMSGSFMGTIQMAGYGMIGVVLLTGGLWLAAETEL